MHGGIPVLATDGGPVPEGGTPDGRATVVDPAAVDLLRELVLETKAIRLGLEIALGLSPEELKTHARNS